MTYNTPICFLFSDLPDSTELWEANQELMATCHRTYYTLIRNLLPQFSGTEVKNLGDGFFIIWPSSVVEFRTRKDQERGITPKSGKGITTRLGMHFGVPFQQEIDPTSGRMDFHGNAPNVAARIMTEADGDEIVVSDAVILDICEQWNPAGGVCTLDRVERLEKAIKGDGLGNEFEFVRKGNTNLRGIKNPFYLTVIRLRR